MAKPKVAEPTGPGPSFPWQHSHPAEARAKRRLRWSMVVGLLVMSAVPFAVIGAGAWFVFRDLAIGEALALHRNMARAHAAAVDAYLSEQVRTVEMIARTHTLAELRDSARLRAVFESVADVQGNSFVDLGVIDENGRHLAYVGPYDLMGRNYYEADWFRTVMMEGVSVSDVFLGFRQNPHSVIAVRQPSADGWWILRATLDNTRLYALVRSLSVGRQGDVFILNRQGVYQTPPRSGEVLATSSIEIPPRGRDLPNERLGTPEGAVRRVSTWLNGGRWLMVVQQPEREILTPVARAVGNGALIAIFALFLVFIATVVVTSRLIAQIGVADRQRDLMYRDVLRSARLASLGEMASGLAHEINNPLAIMRAEHTNLADGFSDLDLPEPAREAVEQSLQRCRRQVERCRDVTTKMLQFGQGAETRLGATDLAPALREVAGLLARTARDKDAAIETDAPADLPPAWLDGSELEQVLLNLVGNALDAVDRGGVVKLSAAREGDGLVVRVSDNGCGISADDVERIFQPFFTTKPPGQGTGLGLAVVYGLVSGWGATIEVDSAPGQGTTMSIHVPAAAEAREAGGAAAPTEPSAADARAGLEEVAR
jgi:two-component system, NtrC family, sensor kinase